jgi:hypothetical protein
MAYVATTSELFRVMKRALYEWVAGKQKEAQMSNEEFQRPLISDYDIQVITFVLQARTNDPTAKVESRSGKMPFEKALVYNQFLDGFDPKQFVKTQVLLPESEHKAFLRDVAILMSIPNVRRQALLDVIKTGLPKIEGFGMRSQFTRSLETGEGVDDFLELENVEDKNAEAA